MPLRRFYCDRSTVATSCNEMVVPRLASAHLEWRLRLCAWHLGQQHRILFMCTTPSRVNKKIGMSNNKHGDDDDFTL